MRLLIILLMGFGLMSCGSDDILDLVASGGNVASCNDSEAGVCSSVDYGNELLGQIGRAACEDDENGAGLELVESCPAASCVASCALDLSAEGGTFVQTLYYYTGEVVDLESACTASSGTFASPCDL